VFKLKAQGVFYYYVYAMSYELTTNERKPGILAHNIVMYVYKGIRIHYKGTKNLFCRELNQIITIKCSRKYKLKLRISIQIL